ncbi:hypothetical protein NLY43_06970 [Mesorhizobium sp. C416B]|uniref:hypothetical protein n=1 Tax=unclassified Mesorhizobium TaxID=325217 RepID=UPI0003CEA4B6|nr:MULTISPECIES: hypothetical protein [unclassified Mesorhizobium]ESX46669.1 hypothetical protein X762_21535 [Mesorhizobium sp. LSHC426A00]ESX54460.1 hypothetical protein X761_16705 [Mesorhizobium sp. LSHC424B00]ESX72370.1 hypothetical protein X758_14710 [Mesorhizobium sp. LSHC416B00]WJI64497.1 hypothetical protein NLY43_06970 [Mesorhizobium sp. C416B]
MNSKSTKSRRRKIPMFNLKELEEAGKIPPYSHLRDPLERLALDEERKEATKNTD